MNDAGLYVFGIVAADHPCRVEDLSGIAEPGTAVWRVATQTTAAVVCAAPAIPEGTAKSRLRRGLATLADRLAEEGIIER